MLYAQLYGGAQHRHQRGGAPRDRVVTTVLEHNSVLRPLNRLATEQGVTVGHAGCDASGVLDYDGLERLVTPGTRAVVVTHASNVTGNAVDIARVAAMAHAAVRW